MIANKTVEFLQNLIDRQYFPYKFIDCLNDHSNLLIESSIKDIVESVKFDLGSGIPKAFKFNYKNLANDFFPKLPYESCFFLAMVGEDETPCGLMLSNVKGFINAGYYVAFFDENNEFAGLHPSGIVIEGIKNGTNDTFNVWNGSDPKYSEKLEGQAFTALYFVMKAIEAMNCTNVKVIDSPHGSRFVNQRRKQKGLLPLFTYKTLHIDTSEKEVNRFGGTGTHASPRLHLRRGHIRKLATGKSVWVQSCMVGDPSKGFADKDYALHVA